MSEIQQTGDSIECENTGDLVEDAKIIIDSAQRLPGRQRGARGAQLATWQVYRG